MPTPDEHDQPGFDAGPPPGPNAPPDRPGAAADLRRPYPPLDPDAPAARRLPLELAGALLAAAVVVAVVLVRLVGPLLVQTPVAAAAAEDDIGAMLSRVQGAYIVGASKYLPPDPSMSLTDQAAVAMNVGSLGQRERFVVLAGELDGAAEGRARLDALQDMIPGAVARGYEVSEDDQRAIDLLERIYPDVASETTSGAEADAARVRNLEAIGADDRAFLVDHLDWFGSLALAPEGVDGAARDAVMKTAVRVFFLFMGVIIVGGLGIFGGFVGLIVMFVLALTGRLATRIQPGTVPPGALLETFAIWLAFFFGLQLLAGVIATLIGGGELTLVFFGFLASLTVLAWLPLRTGLPWHVVRRDVGLHPGNGPVEPFAGVLCYLCGLPILGVGLVFTYLLMAAQSMFAPTGAEDVFEPVGGPAHPIIGQLGSGNVAVLLQVLLIGSVAAPIVEETMFRGVLYRSLREYSRPIGFFLSVAAATVLNTAVFALIHPQGLVAVPALMGLAASFTLAREWRGSLIAPMTMHALSNGIVLVMVFNLFGV